MEFSLILNLNFSLCFVDQCITTGLVKDLTERGLVLKAKVVSLSLTQYPKEPLEKHKSCPVLNLRGLKGLSQNLPAGGSRELQSSQAAELPHGVLIGT